MRDGLVSLLQRHGGQLRTDTPVERIMTAGGVVKGVRLQGGEDLLAGTVIANADVPAAYALLDDAAAEERAAQRAAFATAEFSAGVIAYYWSVRRRVEGLSHHNVFLSGACQQQPLRSADASMAAYLPWLQQQVCD